MKGIQNVNNIIPNLHELNLQQQDINKLNELFKATNLSSHPTSTSKQPMLQSTQLSKIRNQHSYQSTVKNSIQTSLFNLLTVNQAQTSRQKYKFHLNSISSSKGCRKMQQLALQCKEKSQKMRENSLQSQINFLKQQSQTLQRHISTINRKYSQKRQQANTYMLKYLQQKDNNQQLLNKYNRLQKQLRDQRVRITNAFNDRLCVQKQEFIAKQSQYHLKIGKLENDIGKLTQLLTFTQKQYLKIKELLSIETNKRTIKQQQFSNSHNQFNQSINALKEQLSKAQKQLYKKQKELFQKDQYISSIQKSFKQLNKRLLYTEQLNRKQLMKEKAIAKRAIDGLQMTRKYSQLELNKSRKKQKDYINKQKELISIIKQISKNRNNTEQQSQKQKQKQKVDKSIGDTTDISYRKSEIKSLNTTLKIRKDERQTMSPFVSNFQIQDTSQQHINQLSPINAIKKQQDLTFKKQNQLKYNRSISRLQLKGNNPQYKDQYNIKSKQNKNRNKNANTNMNMSQQSSLKNSTISVNINLDVFTSSNPSENDRRNKKKDIKVQLQQDRDITIGTPCFQVHNNDKLFKAIKRY